MYSPKNRDQTERATIEHQIAKVEASIASVEIAAESQREKAKGSEAGRGTDPKASDRLVELLIARLLRVAYRDGLLKDLSRRLMARNTGR